MSKLAPEEIYRRVRAFDRRLVMLHAQMLGVEYLKNLVIQRVEFETENEPECQQSQGLDGGITVAVEELRRISEDFNSLTIELRPSPEEVTA